MILGLRSFQLTERPLFLEIFIFLSRHFSYVEKRLDEKAKISFNIYEVRDSTSNYYNTHIGQNLKKYRQPVNDL